ncbi:hypothetical protein GDO86_004567 [Hymenochirus boettgeri]|uniref:Uncharacterized protein n=1 Tax=Hymenochirus boettgeri TaxID=247094 RepID=A0A8T2K5P4_9PIPI|nr:hypothetical protein GDO86_004567 [Hymenochirus boettgeri]
MGLAEKLYRGPISLYELNIAALKVMSTPRICHTDLSHQPPTPKSILSLLLCLPSPASKKALYRGGGDEKHCGEKYVFWVWGRWVGNEEVLQITVPLCVKSEYIV